MSKHRACLPVLAFLTVLYIAPVSMADPINYVAVHTELTPTGHVGADAVGTTFAGINDDGTNPSFPGLLAAVGGLVNLHQGNNAVMQLSALVNSSGEASAVAYVNTTWGDYITYSSPIPPPTLKLSFTVHVGFSFLDPPEGFVGPQGMGGSFGYKYSQEFDGNIKDYITGRIFTGNYPHLELAEPPSVPSILDPYGGFDSIDARFPFGEVNSLNVTATFSFAVPYQNGQYGFVLNTFVDAAEYFLYNHGVWATDAAHTVSLTGIFLPDGSPVDPKLISFASGFQFDAGTPPATVVPEPGSLALLTLGLGGVFVRRLRRRRRRS